MCLYKADLINTEIGNSKHVCNCNWIQTRSINVTNRHNTFLDINNIRTHDDKSAINNLQIDVFYRLLKQVIQKLYPLTFDFEGRNMAVCVEDGCFDDLIVLEKFKTSLSKYYKFNAPIDMNEVNVVATDDQDIDAIPFMNNDDETITKFTDWIENLP